MLIFLKSSLKKKKLQMCFSLESRSRTWQTFKLYLTKFSLSFATNRKQNLMLAHLGHII